MPNNTDVHSGASQLALLLAKQAGPGFSKNPGDYAPMRVKFSGDEFNKDSRYHRSDLDPLGFLIGGKPIGAEGVPVIVLGMLSGYEERDRVMIDGEKTTRCHAIWRQQPEVEYVKGKGGGKKTDRGGWIIGARDEIFMLINRQPAVLTLYDQHDIVKGLNRKAMLLGAGAMYEIAWTLTKVKVTETTNDVEYTHVEPMFEPLGVAGHPSGPSEVETAQATKLAALIGQLSYQPLPPPPASKPIDVDMREPGDGEDDPGPEKGDPGNLGFPGPTDIDDDIPF